MQSKNMNSGKQMFDTANAFVLIASEAIDAMFKKKDSETTEEILNEYYEKLYASEDESEWEELDALWATQFEDHYELIIPIIVNSAFAAELFIKSILTAKQIQYCKSGAKGHNLEYLFGQLESDMKESIKSVVTKNINIYEESEDFDDKLKSASNAFNDWRYWFEKENKDLWIYFFFNFVYALNVEAEKLFLV